jgi:hypothetical protein
MKNALLFALLAAGTTLTFASVNATPVTCAPLSSDTTCCGETKGGDKGKNKENNFINDCGCGDKGKTKGDGEKEKKSE